VTDLESHLVFMQSRHYDPTLGRFLQADSQMIGGPGPQGVNPYVYCMNDPVNMTDAAGTIAFPVLLVVIAFVLALLWSLIKSLYKRAAFRCVIRKLFGTAVDSIIGALTSFGFYGWLGIGLILIGAFFALWPMMWGWGFAVGGVIIVIGLVLILYDRLQNAVMDAIVDWLVSDASIGTRDHPRSLDESRYCERIFKGVRRKDILALA